MAKRKQQYFRSKYGRKGIRVSLQCPTVSIRYWLGRVHVGTSVGQVEQDIRDQVQQARDRDVQGWTKEAEDEAVRFALWQHAENRAEYEYVSGGLRQYE